MTDLRALYAGELAEDREARRVAQTEFDLPVLLEAGAGTGKTTTLVARVLLWCLGRGWSEAEASLEPPVEPDQIAAAILEGVVAITFTEAAAAEMAARVADGLAAVADGEAGERLVGIDLELLADRPASETLAHRARALLGALDRLEVRTIHAFCHRLLTARALDAGLHPEFRIDPDGFEIEALAAEVVEAQVRAAYGGSRDHPLIDLGADGRGPRALVEAVTELAREAFPAAELARDPFSEEASAARHRRLAEAVEQFLDRGGERLRGATASANGVATVRAALATREALPGLAGAGVEAAARLSRRLAEIWDPRWLQRLGEWGKSKFNKSEGAAVGEDAEAVAEAAAPLARMLGNLVDLEAARFDLARRALEPILAQLDGELRRAGITSFSALLIEAVELLGRRATVRRRERRRIQQLLVDEFQDTDRRQCELVRRLALEGPEADRPGLFVVGDPKQTIYGWRNADLEAYEAFVADAERAGGRRWTLVENFRSAAPLLEEVERALEPVLVERPGLQPPFQPLLPCERLAGDPGHLDAERAPVEYWNSTLGGGAPANGTADASTRLEAEAVAADIAGLVASGATAFSRVGVLLRASTRVDAYLEAMRAAGIPFAVVRDKQYYMRREIIDAAALVRAVLHPADHLALVAWLRSPAVGVPDAAWYGLWQRDFPRLATELEWSSGPRWQAIETAVRETAAALPGDVPGLDRLAGWEASLLAALAGLADLRRAWAVEPADRFLDRLRSTLLPEPVEAARFLGAYRLANLERFFRRLGEALEETGGDTQAVLRTLRRSVAEARESAEARPQESAEDAVQVLTIHAAKGLEFDHLYLVQAGAGTWGSRNRPADLDETRRLDRTGAYALFGLRGPDFDEVLWRRQRVEAAERVRLLYVALTRARRRMVTVGQWPAPNAKLKPPDRAGSHCELLARRRRPDRGTARAIAALQPGGALRDAHGALWRRLDPAAPAADAPRPEVEVELPSPAEAARRVASHRAAREAARARSERPLLEAASAEAGARLARQIEDSAAPGSGAAALRPVALAVGEAVHRLFETWRFDADPAEELERQRAAVLAGVAAALPTELAEAGRERAARLLDRLAGGSLLARFTALGDAVLARELPLLLPAGAAPEGPVGAWTGAVDLLYRDPDSGLPVIVDFKTDLLAARGERRDAQIASAAKSDARSRDAGHAGISPRIGDAADSLAPPQDGRAGEEGEGDPLAARAEAYAPQEAVYREAVRQAFDLAAPPPFELWFLWPDRVWRID